MREFRLSTAAESEMETALMLRDGRRRGSEIVFLCPAHPDDHPSASYHVEKHVWVCRVCRAGGGYVSLTEALRWTS